MTSENSTSYDHLTLADHGATSMAELYIEGTILIIIALVALVGNVSVYFIVIRNKKLRTITNFFILGLAAADILVSVANMPVTAVALFAGNWPLDYMSCLVFGFINMLTLCSSVLSLCNISINRYVMICRPFQAKVIYTQRNAVLMVLGKNLFKAINNVYTCTFDQDFVLYMYFAMLLFKPLLTFDPYNNFQTINWHDS